MYEKITLKNGVRIVYENIPYVRSVTAGIWVGTGSRYETAEENGASHFIEHMVFKGTDTRSAAELASIMDGIGGQINAFTTKECTCFYGRVLDTHLERLTDILCDMLFNSRFDDEDVSNERGVIFEEIDMYEDSPEDLATENMLGKVFKGTVLKRPILGTKKTLSKMDGAFLRNYMKKHYAPDCIVVSVSGSFTQGDIDYLCEKFEKLESSGKNVVKTAKYTPGLIAKRKNIEQNHICLGFPGTSIIHNDRYTMQLLNTILGGGMSSRLFQTVREKYGLCYSVYSFSSAYIDTGVTGVYTAVGSQSEDEAIKVIIEEIKRLKEYGVGSDELERAREQAISNTLMSLESTASRMNRLARNELYFGRIPEIEEIIEGYNSVAAEDIAKASSCYLNFDNMAFSAVGKVQSAEKYAEKLSLLI